MSAQSLRQQRALEYVRSCADRSASTEPPERSPLFCLDEIALKKPEGVRAGWWMEFLSSLKGKRVVGVEFVPAGEWPETAAFKIVTED